MISSHFYASFTVMKIFSVTKFFLSVRGKEWLNPNLCFGGNR